MFVLLSRFPQADSRRIAAVERHRLASHRSHVARDIPFPQNPTRNTSNRSGATNRRNRLSATNVDQAAPMPSGRVVIHQTEAHEAPVQAIFPAKGPVSGRLR